MEVKAPLTRKATAHLSNLGSTLAIKGKLHTHDRQMQGVSSMVCIEV